MKAYCIYPGKDTYDEGCVLVFAKTRNKAKVIAWQYGPWITDYIDFNARRVPNFDKYNKIKGVYGRPLHETNETLPEPFFDDRRI